MKWKRQIVGNFFMFSALIILTSGCASNDENPLKSMPGGTKITISYVNSRAQHITLAILEGPRVITRLVDEPQSAGRYFLFWEAKYKDDTPLYKDVVYTCGAVGESGEGPSVHFSFDSGGKLLVNQEPVIQELIPQITLGTVP